jgi:hypothetical protein
MGWTNCKWSDECVWIKRAKSGRIMIIGTYVDDIPYAYHQAYMGEMLEDIATLNKQFAIKILGDAEFILNWRIKRDREARTITIDQEAYTAQLLEEYGMHECKTVDTPGTAIKDLYADPLKSVEAEVESPKLKLPRDEIGKMSVQNYPAVIGSLQYLATSTRPDIANAVNMLARFLSKPEERRVRGAKRVLRYLAGTKDYGIVYGNNDLGSRERTILHVFSDSDHATDIKDRKSVSGFVAKLNGAAISWYSQAERQSYGIHMITRSPASGDRLRGCVRM